MGERSHEDSLRLVAGDRLTLADGSVVEITENPRDGVWLFCTYLSSPDADLQGRRDEAVYTTDVTGFAD